MSRRCISPNTNPRRYWTPLRAANWTEVPGVSLRVPERRETPLASLQPGAQSGADAWLLMMKGRAPNAVGIHYDSHCFALEAREQCMWDARKLHVLRDLHAQLLRVASNARASYCMSSYVPGIDMPVE
jgi:hypothetical protein